MREREIGAARVRRLLAEIRADRSALTTRTDEIVDLCGPVPTGSRPRERTAALALALDRTYTVLESILERIARSLEGGLPTAQDWHRSLLGNASLRIPNVRPPVLREAVVKVADQLRRFRHFLRHAYAAELSVERLRKLANAWLAERSELDADLDEFEKFLEDLARQLESES
jgi:hypothetical protein